MNYLKLTNIVKYYEKNEEQLLESYHSYVYDQLNPSLNCERDTSKVVPQTFVSHIIFHYSFDTYFKSVVKKGKGDYPTCQLMKWVRNNYKQLESDFVSENDMNYNPLNLLIYILGEYNDSFGYDSIDTSKLESFIETI